MVETMYKYHLADVKWKEMYFIDIFDNIYIAKSTDQNKLKVGNVPFIGRSSINNGLQGEYFVEKEKINKGSSLTISMVGEPKCFYHKYSFTCSQNILVLQNNEFINITNSKFLIPIIDNYLKAKGYGYGYPVGKERVLRNKLLLPVDKNNQINWNFMEEYIKERENKQREELKEYYKSRLLDLVVCPEVLNDVDWKEIFIEEVAEIYSGKDIYERERTIGNTPYITATANNNGIGYFVENENKTMESECISVNRNGSVGYAFYHCYEALYGNDTRKLKPFIKNKYTALFITHAITSQKDKYGYGYKMGTGRLKRQKIMLPVSDGEVNYKYMENFIKNIEQKQIKNILKYLDEYIYIYIMYNHFDKVEWKEFFLDEICNINSGVRLTKANMNEGKMPFIGATDSNNGITNFVSNTNKSLDKNVLGVNYNGSVVENFYHPYECIFSDDVKRVSFKDEQGQNKYCYLFLKQMILQQKEKYRYAYKFNGDRMARQ